MTKIKIFNIIKNITRVSLALVIVLLALAGPLAATAYGQASTVDLSLSGDGATNWTLSGILPGVSGTKTVTLHNNSSVVGNVYIWITNITETDFAHDGAMLDNYLLFNLSAAGLQTNISLPAKISQLPQSVTSSNYLKVASLAAGSTATLNWQWSFPATALNDAQGDSFTFTIKYTLITEEVVTPVVEPEATAEPSATPAPTATPALTVVPTATPAPTQEPATGQGLGLMVNTIPDTPVIGNVSSATSTSGEQISITGSLITIEEKNTQPYVNIPVALPQGETLATYTDSNGTTFHDNKLVFTSFDRAGEPEVTVTINTDNATGKGESAVAKVESMFLDVLEKKTDIAPRDLTNEEWTETDQSEHVASQLPAGVSASINVTLLTIPENAAVHSTITTTLSSNVQTALELLIVDDNLIVDDIAFVLEVEKKNLPNQTVLGEARITMKVSAEYAQEVGIENFRIYRFDGESGQGEMLETQFLGYDDEGKAVFVGISPNGLSVFVLTILERLSRPTVVPLTVTPTATSTSTITIDIDVLGKVTQAKATNSGTILESVRASDSDETIVWDIHTGSVILTSGGKVPRRLEIRRIQITPPENTLVVDGIYQAQAYLYSNSNNASMFTISPASIVSLNYRKANLPGGTNYIFPAYFDTLDGWIKLPSIEIAERGSVSIQLKGPLTFTMMVELGSSSILNPFFRVSNLVVEPTEAKTGEEIAASVIVTNVGKTAGTLPLEIKLDGTVISRTEVSLESGESRIVTSNFNIDNTGIHTVEIVGLRGKVTIVSSRNILPIALSGIFPVIIFLAYRKRRQKDEWNTGLKEKHWLVNE